MEHRNSQSDFCLICVNLHGNFSEQGADKKSYQPIFHQTNELLTIQIFYKFYIKFQFYKCSTWNIEILRVIFI